ncbi:MAG: polysaccharide biosynthesis protein [Gammaproteobacteria bacterium]|nr:polysaccharide biosynthesis protein [Gammaproteobacteria bacterium]
MLVADLVWLPLSILLSISINVDNFIAISQIQHWSIILLTSLLTILAFLRLGLYRSVIRFMGIEAIIAVVKGVSLSVLIFFLLILLLSNSSIPYSTTITYWSISLFFVGGSRFIIWRYYQHLFKRGSEKVAIYGAGEAGRQLLMALQHGDEYQTIAFIDDNKKLEKRIINGIQVYSSRKLDQLVKSKDIKQILIAIPSLTNSQRKMIISKLEHLPVHVKKIPILADIVSGKANIEELREVEIEDLLGRDIVVPNEQLFEKCIKNKHVMVTGAGGSIGSELCRQIIKHQPARLVLYELSEIALYSIEQELIKLIAKDIELIPLLGSVQDKRHLKKTCQAFKINTIYHSAAYKHVPIVEHNIIEGIKNNIIGTANIAEVSQETGVSTVVLISTDKAVRPTNIMGASKRFAEMVLQSMAKRHEGGNTRYCIVRFGNVLGSSGSVVPLFQKQIKQGGPVTVTHLEIERYFMTIPEAAQLVIQAGALDEGKGSGGDVYVLDMGEPVKVIDLAKKMIHLSGYEILDEKNPHGDIEIIFTGLRPGEKLYEELLIGDNVSGTEHPRIMRAEEKMLSTQQLEENIRQLIFACQNYELETLISILIKSETGYQPDNKSMVDLIYKSKTKSTEENIYHLQRK